MIVDWVNRYGLHLNLKTKCLVISRKHRPSTPSLTVSNTSIEQVPSFYSLGVMVSCDLSWSLHISLICCKAKRLREFLYRNFRDCDYSCVSHLYKALVLPILEYCSCMWDPLQVYNKEKLESVQGFTAKLATRKWSKKHCCSV